VHDLPGGGARLELRAERLDWAPALLAGLDHPFTIERPAELRDRVRTLADRLAEAASAATWHAQPE
jgi:WYL domain